MENTPNEPHFDVHIITTQTPFDAPATRSFFKEWCRVNDSIEPEFLDREDWEQRRHNGLLEKTDTGKQKLLIPRDLQLWEMVGVMEAVDHDTFALQPARQHEKKDALIALGGLFENAGVYIAQRLDALTEGQPIAQAMAEEFYEYGRSIKTGQRPEAPPTIDDIQSQTLTAEETERVDRFLAGEALYNSRKSRAEKRATENPERRDEYYELERRHTVNQFFRAAKKSFEATPGRLLELPPPEKEPWKTPTTIYDAFIAKVKHSLTKAIEAPKQELESAIFRRGMELLGKHMPFDQLPQSVKDTYLHWQNGEQTLHDALEVDRMWDELRTVRKKGDVAEITAKEREITDTIQAVVSQYPRMNDANNPSEIILNQTINCVGASMLGGTLLKEAGVNYLVDNVPHHSLLFLVTADGQVEWRDMLFPQSNEILTNEVLGKNREGTPVTAADIVSFSRNPKPEGLLFDLDNPKYREKIRWIDDSEHKYISIFPPEEGQKIQVLNNVASALDDLGDYEKGTGNKLEANRRYEQAIEAYRQGITIDPKDAYLHCGLGNALQSLDRHQEAVDAYRQGITIDPNEPFLHNGLGNTLRALGRTKEAIDAYRQFIALADPKTDAYWIQRAEGIIAELTATKPAEPLPQPA